MSRPVNLDATADAGDPQAAAWDAAESLRQDPEVEKWLNQAIARPAKRRARRRAATAALAVALAVGGYHLSPYAREWWGAGEQVFVASQETPSRVTLGDGSVIVIDRGAKVTVSFSDKHRNLSLDKGHVYFTVAHDPSRPFAVRAGGLTVTAVGTAFDIRTGRNETDVALIEGHVRVAASGRDTPPVLLQPDTRLRANGDGWSVAPIDLTRHRAWALGRHVFLGETLAQAAGEMNQYAATKIIVDPALASLPVRGVFAFGDTARFAESIADLHGVGVETVDGWKVLKPTGKIIQKPE